jgi:predicted RNA-binding Zn ribbon-like protein
MPATSEKLETVPPEFIFVGEHSALDFANTFVMTNGQETDYLRTWADMVDWFSLTGLSVDPGLKLSAAHGAEAHKSVVEFRQAWKAELARIISGNKVSDEFIERLNRLLADTFHEKLDLEGKNGFRLVHSISQLHGKKLALAILGRQIAVFLAESNSSYLRRCANTTSCRLYFYDTTKNHRRQWCSVATCGNRNKVAQFRKRQAKINWTRCKCSSGRRARSAAS